MQGVVDKIIYSGLTEADAAYILMMLIGGCVALLFTAACIIDGLEAVIRSAWYRWWTKRKESEDVQVSKADEEKPKL